MPKISVIIPTYNRANFIVEAVQSVLSQSFDDFELIIIDDGSDDNTNEIIQSLPDKRIRYFLQENSGRPAHARNKGIQLARGEYIAFLDSDDIWYKNKLEKQITAIETREDILAVATNLVRFPKENVKGLLAFRQGSFNLMRNKTISFKAMLTRSFVCNSSVMVKKKIFDEIGLLDERIELKAVEDYEYWLRILDYRDRSIMVLKDILVAYRLHDNSIGICDTDEQQKNKVSIIFENYKEKYPLLIEKAKKRRSL